MEEQTPEVKGARQMVERYNLLCEAVDERKAKIDEAKADPNTTKEDRDKLVAEFYAATASRDELYDKMQEQSKLEEARAAHVPLIMAGETYKVASEPDMYRKDNAQTDGMFFRDLYMAQIKGDHEAQQRINKHQAHEVEKRATTTATLGGIIPPAYLVDMYAKASRNGRVFANEVNNQTLPDVGMSIVVPRLTAGLSVAAQTTQNTAVVSADVTEADLTVNVNTLSGFTAVSRQSIERAAYSDRILFEDLLARYYAILDTYCINGSGSNNQPLGLLNTSSIATSTASTATVAGVYPKIADVIQQIATNVGGLGYQPDRIFMHPRRWGFFNAALDTSNRPLIVPMEASAFNPMAGGQGSSGGYGYTGYAIQGLPVFTDANIPTTLGATTNADAIIVCASPIVHLFERQQDPVSLSFEQQAGTSLQVQLIAYGYVAFTAGRYPGASGAVTGAGLVPPSF